MIHDGFSTVSTEPESDAAMAERCLLAQIAVGDRTAFRELYARYSAPLFTLAIRMMNDPGDAEEAVQDAFVKIWRHAPTYDARKARPFTWAVMILRRTCIDRLRRRTGWSPIHFEAEETLTVRADTPSPSQQAITREDTTRVRAALETLPVPQRSALDLALFSGLTQAEIAGRLAQPIGTIKTWIRRGLLDLRAALKQP